MNIPCVNRVGAALGSVLILMALASAAWPNERVRLPSAQDTIRARIRAEQLLRGGRGPERVLPGPVTDEEKILVALEPDGTPSSVIAVQSLDIEGVGDYFFKIPGPVRDVQPLAGSTGQPGLRSKSVVWQGFSNGEEHLAARLTLDPSEESDRLPIDATLDATVDGNPIETGDSGDLMLDIKLTNTTARPISLPSAIGSPDELVPALGSLHAVLAFGDRPQPGADGIPRAVTAVSPVENKTELVAAPLAYTIDVEGKAMAEGVLSGSNLEADVNIEVEDWSSTWPDVVLRVDPSPPDPSEAQRRVGPRKMFDTLVRAMAEAARLPDVDAYVGSPDPTGQARSSYVFTFVAASTDTVAPPIRIPEDPGVNILALVLASILGALVLVAAVVVWSLN
ncbi:MAG: hypothetical protein QOG54_2444 [Actinomycetota bacterium]|nr:hypothetical protein [Actinomycetota bacterium]